ncbi:hypothetical protein V5799_006968 [Amblyomma americanum]|uniref:Uncharacterized protein n=1 Tax=Amblyomma americanum TaxID=6943 RepID=A0AAQ4DUV9_AMBAM
MTSCFRCHSLLNTTGHNLILRSFFLWSWNSVFELFSEPSILVKTTSAVSECAKWNFVSPPFLLTMASSLEARRVSSLGLL